MTDQRAARAERMDYRQEEIRVAGVFGKRAAAIRKEAQAL